MNLAPASVQHLASAWVGAVVALDGLVGSLLEGADREALMIDVVASGVAVALQAVLMVPAGVGDEDEVTHIDFGNRGGAW